MGGLNASLSIALQSLQVEEGAISTTSNNVANVDTPGYSRQIPNIAETPPIELGQVTFGTGVQLQGVTSTRDSILDLRVNQETQQQGQLKAFKRCLMNPAGLGCNRNSRHFSAVCQGFRRIPAIPTPGRRCSARHRTWPPRSSKVRRTLQPCRATRAWRLRSR
jgi:hypothetical protein